MRWIKPLAWTAAVLVMLAGAYAWAGYWLAPRLIKSKLPPAVAEATGQRLTLGTVTVKPFELSVDVSDIVLTEPDGAPLLGAKHLFIDAELASIWRRGVVLRALVLDEPAVNVVLRADGSVNLVSAFEPKAPPPPGEDAGSPLLINVVDIQINRGVIDATDQRRDAPFTERLAPINVRVQNFTTTTGGAGSFNLAGRGEHAESLSLNGRVVVRPFALSGNLQVKGLSAAKAWEIAGRYASLAPPAGVIDLETHYDIASTADGVRMTLAALAIDARDLAVCAAGATDDWIKVVALSASGASVDLREALMTLPDIRVQGLDVRAWTDEGGKINLEALAPADDVAPASNAPSTEQGKPWRIEAPLIRVTGAHVEFEDREAPQPVKYVLAPLELDIDGYASNAAAARLALRSSFNGTGRLDVTGDWQLDNSGGTFTVDARTLPVVFAQPYLDATTDLVLKSGELTVAGKVGVERPAEADAKIDFDGSVTLANFHSVDRALREDFIKFGNLALTGVSYKSAPASLRIRDVLARGAYFKFVIAPDQTTNIADVLAPPRLRKAAAQTDVAAPAPGRAMTTRIDRIRLAASSANFADLSIRPNFATGIEELAGTITGLSSDPDARAEVTLDGKVDRYAPVEIRGQVNYLSTSTYTDLSADFRNIELPTFTPYSGKFMGYKIEKGKLNAKFHYLIDHRKLDAQHKFVLDQFTLGERVDSNDAVHLPMKLAVALLKDRNGVIDIDLPISGTLDDPTFRVGPLVWKVLKNLLVKIVTAPFALIGSLFGAGEEVRFVDFAYGSAALDAAAQERLANVGKALVDRPQLKLEVPLVSDAARDRAALVDARIDAMLGGAAVRDLRTSDPDAYQTALDAAWREATGEKRVPRPERQKDEEKDAWALRTIDAGEAALRERAAVTDADLAALAKQRADSVRDALIATTGLDAARVFITAGAAEAAATNGVRLALKVE